MSNCTKARGKSSILSNCCHSNASVRIDHTSTAATKDLSCGERSHLKHVPLHAIGRELVDTDFKRSPAVAIEVSLVAPPCLAV